MIGAAAAARQDRKHKEWSRRNAALFTDSVEADLRASLAAHARQRSAERDSEILQLTGGSTIAAIDYADYWDMTDDERH